MIWLHPETGGPVDPVEAVAAEARPPLPDRPWVLTNMVASADGATAVAGLSGQLGGPADQAVFAALRGVADAIVVGAATVRAERYRVPGLGGDQQQAGRAARGQAPRPRIVVVTASLGLDPELPLFTEPDHRPVIATTDPGPGRGSPTARARGRGDHGGRGSGRPCHPPGPPRRRRTSNRSGRGGTGPQRPTGRRRPHRRVEPDRVAPVGGGRRGPGRPRSGGRWATSSNGPGSCLAGRRPAVLPVAQTPSSSLMSRASRSKSPTSVKPL